MKFVIKRTHSRWPFSRPQRWHFVLASDNNQIVATSENYTNRRDAQLTVEHIIALAQDATVIMEVE